MFKVGEILIVREDSDALAEYKGREVEVMEHRPWYTFPYRLRFRSGEQVAGKDQHLRRKKPPTEYKGEQEILSLFKVKPREVCDAG
jgi:hypothetical protein